MKKINVKVKVKQVFSVKEDGWCSFRAYDPQNNVLHFAGVLSSVPKPGMLYEIEAEPKHTKFGIQYSIVSAVPGMPETMEGIYEYLSSGHIQGIGPVTARKLIDVFGTDTLNVIHETPERLLEINGISKKKLERIKKCSEENRLVEDVYRFTNGAVTKLQVKKLLEKYGDQTVKMLRENPYKTLCELDNIGFLKADKVALKCGIAEDSLIRTTNAVLYVLNDVITTNGDCYVPISRMEQETVLLLTRYPAYLDKIRGAKSKVFNAADSYERDRGTLIKTLGLDKEQVKELDEWMEKRRKSILAIADAIMSLLQQDLVWYDPEKEVIASKKVYETEKQIAEIVSQMLSETVSFTDEKSMREYMDAQEKDEIVFVEEQKQALWRAMKNKLSIITGGPGCGKTTTIALIAGFWHSVGKKIYMMAPTGRAAQRIKESVNEQLPDNDFKTSTIHYLLANDDAQEELQKLKSDDVLVICDETSMVDIRLALQFLKLVKDYRIVLVGDADQLPPVGAGNFFRDLISCGKVPTTWLTKNYRSTGNIIENSRKIRTGNTHLVSDTDFKIMDIDREEIPMRIVKQYMDFLKMPGVTVRDLCVLTLQRKRGVACVAALNQMIQEAYNPAAEDKPEYVMPDCTFRLGDRVIHTTNNYRMLRELKGNKSYGIFNGDLGVIIAFNKSYLADGENDEDLDWVLRVRFDDGSETNYKETELLYLELAYAMTVHKSQGSEFKYVIGTYAMDQFTMLYRAIAYTSATRAKKRYVAICERKALAMAIRNVGSSERNTFLPEML